MGLAVTSGTAVLRLVPRGMEQRRESLQRSWGPWYSALLEGGGGLLGSLATQCVSIATARNSTDHSLLVCKPS